MKRRLSKTRSLIGFCWGSVFNRSILAADTKYLQLCTSHEPGSLQRKLAYFGWRLHALDDLKQTDNHPNPVSQITRYFEIPDEILTYWVSLDHNIDKHEVINSRERYSREIEIWRERAKRAIQQACATIDCLNPKAALYLQGYLPAPYALRSAAAICGIPCVAIEKTFNDRLIIWSKVSGISVNKHEFKLHYAKFTHTLDPAAADAWVNMHRNDHKTLRFKDHKTPDSRFSLPDADKDKPTVLFLGQVHNDSSSHFGLHEAHRSQAHILALLHRICEANQWNLLVKFHPKEASGRDPLNARPLDKATCRKAIKLLDLDVAPQNWDADNNYSTESLIEQADVTVTINSQSSFDSLLLNKPVILCGEAYFDNLGFTHTASSPEDLQSLLPSLLPRSMNKDEINAFRRFFYFLNTRYLKTGTARSIIELIGGANPIA